MTQFLRLLADTDKATALSNSCARLRAGQADGRHFETDPQSFNDLPGKPFAYWVSDALRSTFLRFPAFEGSGRTAKQGLATADDFRFVRAWWEVGSSQVAGKWLPFAKGGTYSPFYSDVYLTVNWGRRGTEMDAFAGSVIRNPDFYARPGLTWPRRTKSRLSMRILPSGCVFADKGPAVFSAEDDAADLLCVLALCASVAFHRLVEVQLAAADARPGGAAHSFEVGVIQSTPLPTLDETQKREMAFLARRAWSLKRTMDMMRETSHVFLLPAGLLNRLVQYDEDAMEADLSRIQSEIDWLAFKLYGFTDSDRGELASVAGQEMPASEMPDDETDDDGAAESSGGDREDLLSWAAGVAFGHFDWRLATRERQAPPEPNPFDPLPTRSPGMLPEGDQPFHANPGILVDDPGHLHDLAHVIEEVLSRVDVAAPDDVRRWLQRDFFPFHLSRYSKSRRKAPIYWPLGTSSGNWTLWIYYPSLTSQTLYTAVNDFVEPKLKEVGEQLAALRGKGTARTRDDERQFEALQSFNGELIELRDSLLKVAPTYKPNHDDGVQISAAPLWSLFRYKPWQKLLKEAWVKLERGEYDWAHLATNYWPGRVREKCKTDRSLAIAHGLESLYVSPEAAVKKARSRQKKGADE